MLRADDDAELSDEEERRACSARYTAGAAMLLPFSLTTGL
jgi:hypothetical protein